MLRYHCQAHNSLILNHCVKVLVLLTPNIQIMHHASASAPVPVESQYYQNKPHQMLQNAKLATISTGSTKLESGNYSFACFLADGGESKSTQVFYADIYGRDNTLRSLLLVPTNTHHAPPDTRYFLAYRVYFSFPW